MVRSEAGRRTASKPALFDDAQQEGLIAWWQAWEKKPGDTRHAYSAARKRIVGYATGHHKSFGHVGHRGWQEVELLSTDPIDLPHPATAETSPEIAYHRPEIREAVGRLTPRQKAIVAKVALGEPLTAPQRTEWACRLRPRLAVELAQLRGLV